MLMSSTRTQSTHQVYCYTWCNTSKFVDLFFLVVHEVLSCLCDSPVALSPRFPNPPLRSTFVC